MENQEILKLLKLNAKLLELHEENTFKIRAFQSAIFNLDKSKVRLETLSVADLEKLPNVGKSIAAAIFEISNKNKFAELEKLLAQTPKGVIELLAIKGVGPKKVRAIWKDLGVENLEMLKQACLDGSITKVKGIGEKLQEEILEFLAFKEASKGKSFYSDVEQLAFSIEKDLQQIFGEEKVKLTGEVRRMMEIVETIQFVIASHDFEYVFEKINQSERLVKSAVFSSPFIWRGNIAKTDVKVEIKIYADDEFASQIYLHSAGKKHLNQNLAQLNGPAISLFNYLKKEHFQSEQDIFKRLNWAEIPSESREGLFEFEAILAGNFPILIEDTDLKGILHNHSTYSDGDDTLEDMAMYCKELGYEYLGISDHSKTATYAQGLREDQIVKQHAEIDLLNQKLAPFKIFKGIESDILGDGSLDYETDVLKTFDFIVASIHANLKMDVEKATARLIKAIENPYTTMLGHPTGRLLLRRQGYPINHAKVIDACAASGVIIEINANPWRLDLDWRWVNYAIKKGVMLSINPDAHEMAGYLDMHYGVCVGRKAGLTKEMTFNALALNEVEGYFKNRQSKF
ncbi:MAG: helix-hairpin-helix domain-containing protein [Cytophagales bacterium]